MVENYQLLFMGLVLLFAGLLFHVLAGAYQYYLNQKYQFRFFALRDDLSCLVMSGEIDPDDKNYKVLINCLNYAIQVTDHFSLREHFGALGKMIHEKQSSDKPVGTISFKCDATREIAAKYYETMISMIRKNSWFEIAIISSIVSISGVLSLFGSFANIVVRSAFGLPARAIGELEKNRTSLLQRETA